MTQMLLFDPPAPVSTYSPSLPTAADQATEQVPATAAAAADQDDADRGGMHRMGDLARLVLMRYELVAQRRAALAAKRK